jgi:hypothetical protein
MRVVFRAKMLAELRSRYTQGEFVRFEAFQDPEGFVRMMRRIAAKNWAIYAKSRFARLLMCCVTSAATLIA